MEYKFGELFQPAPAAARSRKVIDEFALMKNPAYYPFGAGNPSAETFPVEEFKILSQEIFSDPYLTNNALSYGSDVGYEELRGQTLTWLSGRYPGLVSEDDGIMMTQGGLHALSLPSIVMLNKGDVVLVEDPTFGPSRRAFSYKGASVVGIPMEEDGMDLEALEKALQERPTTKMIYVISTFQNPTGYTTSLEKRKELLRLADKYDVLILEDNPYGELRYDGEPIPPIKCLDTEGRVIYAGSYSKVMSPGIRLGYAICSKEIIAQMCKVREDVHTGMLQQVLVSEYMKRYDIDAHVAACCNYYREKRDLMVQRLKEHLPAPLTYSYPEGGLFLWINLPSDMDSVDVMYYLLDHKVLVCDSNRYLLDHSRQGLRLNFSMPSKEKISEGIEVMSIALAKYLAKK